MWIYGEKMDKIEEKRFQVAENFKRHGKCPGSCWIVDPSKPKTSPPSQP